MIIILDLPRMLHGVSTKRLVAWHKFAKKSGLFRDPRDMRILRNILEARRSSRMTLRP